MKNALRLSLLYPPLLLLTYAQTLNFSTTQLKNE